MKKKVIALLMSTCMMLGLAAGGTVAAANPDQAGVKKNEVTKTKAGSSDVTLTLAMCGDGTTKESLDKLLAQYTEETGVKVDTIFIASNWGEYCTKIQTMVGGGDDLDCAILAIEGVAKFLDMGIAEPIDDWIAANKEISDAILSDTSPSFQDVFKDDEGNTYAFPFSFNNVVMHFNTSRLEEAGLELPAADWTKDQFLEYCEKLTTEKDGVKQYAVAVPYGEYFCAEAWLYNNGASYMNEDFTESTINSPEAVEVFQLWQDLIYEYGYAPIPEENVSAIAQIINGQVAMGAWGRWPTANYIADDFKDVAIQYLPTFTVNQQIGGVDGIFTLKNSKHIEEAKELAAWMSQADFEGQYLSSGNIPALHSLAQTKISDLGIPENYEIFYLDSNTDIYKPVSAPPQFTECSNIVLTAISDICVNKSDVQETLDNAAEEMNAVLADNN